MKNIHTPVLKKFKFESNAVSKIECNTTSDWLNQMAYPSRSWDTFLIYV